MLRGRAVEFPAVLHIYNDPRVTQHVGPRQHQRAAEGIACERHGDLRCFPAWTLSFENRNVVANPQRDHNPAYRTAEGQQTKGSDQLSPRPLKQDEPPAPEETDPKRNKKKVVEERTPLRRKRAQPYFHIQIAFRPFTERRTNSDSLLRCSASEPCGDYCVDLLVHMHFSPKVF